MQTPNIIILGGGLSGLATAYWLKKEGWTSRVLEARDRLGGRIHTIRSGAPPLEMGATWLGKKHHHLVDLLDELDIDISKQYMGDKGYYEAMSMSPPQLVDLPPNEEPTYRIAGGTDTLIQSLAERLDDDQILLNQVISSIRKNNKKLAVQTGKDLFEADMVVSTLPPRLLVDRIQFSPSLPDELVNIASTTHTWMAEAIKVALVFEEPFWREADSSGTIFSNVGPVYEMYDHSWNNHYALKGFMDEAYHTVSREERKKLVLQQLRRFYGDNVNNYQSYREVVWRKEPMSYTPYEQHIIPHQHNGHSIYQKSFWDGQLLLSGSETATEFPGYMDGAVESAERIVRRIKEISSG